MHSRFHSTVAGVSLALILSGAVCARPNEHSSLVGVDAVFSASNTTTPGWGE